jgi:hypothetical protein
MPRRRAFVVAIENYAHMNEALATTLGGTHQAAADFIAWLINEQGLAAADIYHCTEDATITTRTAGADRDDIVGELVRLKTAGKDQTDELYFLFCGHGFCYSDVDGARLADVLLAANYRDRATSGNACLKIDEIQKWLRICMGPGDHFCFVDACRNYTTERDIHVGTLGLTYDNSRLGIPTVYTLYSTVEGQLATVNSGFMDVLLAGLNGTGRAKVWRGANMAVLFRSVKEYVDANLMGQPVDERKEGSRDGVIREIAPPPQYTCKVVVQNAAPTDNFAVAVATMRNQTVGNVTFSGTTGSFSQIPDDYNLDVTTPNFTVDPIDPLPADLYSDRTVRFVKRSPLFSNIVRGGPRPTGSSGAPVTIHAPYNASVRVRNLDHGGDEGNGSGTFTQMLSRGRYVLETVDERGIAVQRRSVDVAGTDAMEFDLSELQWSPLRDSLLSGIPGNHVHGAVDFSESLGPTPDQGLDLWIALIGASRIVGGPGDFSKLGPLPLTSFDNAPPGSSPIYLLAGFDEPPANIVVGVSDGPYATPVHLAPHPQFPGLFEWLARDTRPGYHLVSLKVDDLATTTIGACALPDRATLIVVSKAEQKPLRVQQFILPINHLAFALPDQVQRFFVDTPLKSVRRAVEIQRQFAESKELSPIELNELLDMKWFEPISALLAAYELTRRGMLESMPEVCGNLRTYFPEVADTEAIAKIAGLPWVMPAHPPLLLDGFLALDMLSGNAPLPSESIDFRGPWTAWKDAIELRAELALAGAIATSHGNAG